MHDRIPTRRTHSLTYSNDSGKKIPAATPDRRIFRRNFFWKNIFQKKNFKTPGSRTTAKENEKNQHASQNSSAASQPKSKPRQPARSYQTHANLQNKTGPTPPPSPTQYPYAHHAHHAHPHLLNHTIIIVSDIYLPLRPAKPRSRSKGTYLFKQDNMNNQQKHCWPKWYHTSVSHLYIHIITTVCTLIELPTSPPDTRDTDVWA